MLRKVRCRDMATMKSTVAMLPPFKIEPFKGINLSVTPTQIDKSQSPDMLNVNIDGKGALNKRTGYTRVFPTSLGTGNINGMYEYRKNEGTILFLIAHGTKLYKQSGAEQPVQIYDGLNNDQVDFFTLNDTCYLLDGANYLQYDGTTVSHVSPYIPTISISKNPSGGGTKHEDFNLLGAGFKDSFSGDGTAKDYILSLKGLDATAVKVEVNGATMNEGAGFTVDRANGKVTFTTAPATGTNNVIITAYKTQTSFPDRIKKCRFHVLYGGTNDTRVFVSGNPDYKNQIWRSGLYDATYFPENGFYKIGSDREAVTGFAKQYDYLVILKENSIGNMQYDLDGGGVVTFPIKPLNDQVGAIAPSSIQIIENNPVFLSGNGVITLVQSNVRDERNIQHISGNVDKHLLIENNLKSAISVDFDRKYWLSINNMVYIFDYNIGEWYIYDNIPVSCFIIRDDTLYFGSNGLVYRFMKESEPTPYNDDGQPINAYWKSKQFEFEASHLKKTIDSVFFSMKPFKRSSADLFYFTDKKESELIKTKRMDMFDFNLFDFSFFSFTVSAFPQPVKVRIKAKKITYFQVMLQNNKKDEAMGILSLDIKYSYGSEVK